MNVFDFFIGLGKGAEEMKKPMTIEEAIDIIDPNKITEFPENQYEAHAREIKARIMVSDYARKKLDEELKDGRKNDQSHRKGAFRRP